MNHLLISTKHYIHIWRHRNTLLNRKELIEKIKDIAQIEKRIAVRKSKLELHERKWAFFLDELMDLPIWTRYFCCSNWIDADIGTQVFFFRTFMLINQLSPVIFQYLWKYTLVHYISYVGAKLFWLMKTSALTLEMRHYCHIPDMIHVSVSHLC